MTYMPETTQKNFTLPLALAKKWTSFQGIGSKESSRNASGALFLYMLMPAHVREVCKAAAYEPDIGVAMKHFWARFQTVNNDAALAIALLETAQALEEDFDKKNTGKSAKSG